MTFQKSKIYEENLLETDEASFTIYNGGQCETDPSMIRTWTVVISLAPFAELAFHALEAQFV